MTKLPRRISQVNPYLVWNSPRMDVILYPGRYYLGWDIENECEDRSRLIPAERARLVVTGLSPLLVIEDPTPDQLRSVLYLLEKMS